MQMNYKIVYFIFCMMVSNNIFCNDNDQKDQPVKWSEFSFIIKPSPLGGVGVFATHDIPKGTQVFTKDFNLRTLKIKEVPEELLKYCIYTQNDEECLCPERFDRMEIGWYINHSSDPNIARRNIIGNDQLNDLKKKRSMRLRIFKQVKKY